MKKWLLATCIVCSSALASEQMPKLDVLDLITDDWTGRTIQFPESDDSVIISTTQTMNKNSITPWDYNDDGIIIHVLEGELTIENEDGNQVIFGKNKSVYQAPHTKYRFSAGNERTKVLIFHIRLNAPLSFREQLLD
jgi:quercetin dioxygenase-like cupin family protein